MKKIISVLLIAIMVMGCLANVAFASADGNGSVSGSAHTAKAGDQVTVSFVASNVEYLSYNFELNYNKDALEIVKISQGGASVGYFESNKGTGRVAAAHSLKDENDNPINYVANGTLFTVTFKVSDNAKVGDIYNIAFNMKVYTIGGVVANPSTGAGSIEIVCDHKYEGTVTKEATCTAEGVMTYTCTVCGDTYTEAIAKTAHTAKDGWEYDENKHWHICSVCGEKFAEADHTWVNVVDKQPTATEDGHSHDECECGAKGAEYTIPATGEDIDDVPSTGDITPYVVMCAIAVLALLTAVTALVFKRKRTN